MPLGSSTLAPVTRPRPSNCSQPTGPLRRAFSMVDPRRPALVHTPSFVDDERHRPRHHERGDDDIARIAEHVEAGDRPEHTSAKVKRMDQNLRELDAADE